MVGYPACHLLYGDNLTAYLINRLKRISVLIGKLDNQPMAKLRDAYPRGIKFTRKKVPFSCRPGLRPGVCPP